MSIASEITRLQQAKSDLAASIANKGVTVPASATLDEYAALVDQIQAGGTPYNAEIEYLESTGTQYIKTGFVSSNDVFVFDFVASSANTASSSKVIIGADRGFNVSVVSSKYRSTGSCVSTISASLNTPVHIILTATPSSNSLLLEIDESTFSGTYSNFLFNSGIGLFAIGDGTYKSTSRIYSATIYKNNVKIADFIPVRIGMIGCMYDKVSNQIFGNYGTGNFVLGADKNV